MAAQERCFCAIWREYRSAEIGINRVQMEATFRLRPHDLSTPSRLAIHRHAAREILSKVRGSDKIAPAVLRISGPGLLQQAFQPQQAECGDRRSVLDFAVADHPLHFRQRELARHEVLLLALQVRVAAPQTGGEENVKALI